MWLTETFGDKNAIVFVPMILDIGHHFRVAKLPGRRIGEGIITKILSKIKAEGDTNPQSQENRKRFN